MPTPHATQPDLEGTTVDPHEDVTKPSMARFAEEGEEDTEESTAETRPVSTPTPVPISQD